MFDDDEFLLSSASEWRFVSTAAVATLLEAVGALERAATPLTEPPPDRLAHILGGALHDGDGCR